MRIGLTGVGRIGGYPAELTAFSDGAAGRRASPGTPEAFGVAEACELSRERNEPVRAAKARR
jgi:hypothetical protein